MSGSAEDNLNVSLKDITVTQRDGRVSQLDQVYIRGPMIRFYIVPDMLANAPMCVINIPHTASACGLTERTCRFKRIGANAMKGRGIGSARGRATIQRAASASHILVLFLSIEDFRTYFFFRFLRRPKGTRR